jgi:DNA-binding transcriptional MerR regulator
VPTDALPDTDVPADQLLRIQEVADETGLTTRAIRYYEEVGLLAPAARSEGAYRLYDAEDLRRLRFIKGLREDAGFSLAEIRQLLEDEAARSQIRARFRATTDPAERRALLLASLTQVDRQIESLRDKIARLSTMIDEAQARREHLLAHLEANEAGRELPAHEAGARRR